MPSTGLRQSGAQHRLWRAGRSRARIRSAWLLNAIACMDLTTLAGDDTEDRVRRLCAKARRPLADHIVAGLGLVDMPTTGAVCVYPTMVGAAVRALDGTGIPVASVATGFPAGLMPLDLRLAEIRYAVDQGAQEIDIVITTRACAGGAIGPRFTTKSPPCARPAGPPI